MTTRIPPFGRRGPGNEAIVPVLARTPRMSIPQEMHSPNTCYANLVLTLLEGRNHE